MHRARAEAALRESEELLRAVTENSPDAIYVKDRASRWLMANPAVLRIVGRTAEEALGRTDLELYADPAIGRAILENDRRIMEDGRTEAFEEAADTPDGRRTFVSVKAPRRDANGQVIGLIGISRDITERKRAEEALREINATLEARVQERTMQVGAERQRFLDMLDTLPVVIDIIGADRRIEWANRAYREALGENVGRLCHESQFGREAPCEECQAFIPLYSGRPHRWEWTLPNGRTFDIHNFPFAAADGSPAILEMDLDITERRQAEAILKDHNATLERRVAERTAALSESEERFRGIVETAEEGIATHAPDGAITYVNERMAEMLGHSREEIIGRSSLDFVDDEEREAVIAARATVKEHGAFSRERRLRRKDGSALWTLANISPRRDAAGAFVGYLAMHTDITERKQTDAALTKANLALAEADRRKDEFLAMLAHELRNPLAVIAGAGQILQRAGSPALALQHAREAIERQTRHMGRLIDDLLDVARVTQGKIALRKERVQLANIVRDAVDSTASLVESRRQRLFVSVPRDPIPLDGDPVRLVQVVSNVLSNAAKYTQEGGEIHLSVERRDGTADISVRDNGIGIDAGLLPHVFDLFVQGDRAPDREQGGLGIGLTLARSLVEAHGGTIAARSDGMGAGSEFTIVLPLAELAAEAATRESPDTAAALHILVLDDNADAREMMRALLELDGHQVSAAADGRTGIELALRWSPDVALIDLGMPGMDGFEVARRLRREASLGRTVLVAVSGYAQDEHVQRSRDAGFDHHVTKSADFEPLRQVLAAVSARRREPDA